MRKLTGKLQTILNTPYTSKVTLTLQNRYGVPMSSVDSDNIAQKTIEITPDESGSFAVEVHTTELAQDGRYYLLDFGKNANINPMKLYIPNGSGDIDFTECLKPFAPLSFDRFFDGENIKVELLNALNMRMSGQTLQDEQLNTVCDAFFDYADIKPTKIHPLFEAIDEALYNMMEISA